MLDQVKDDPARRLRNAAKRCLATVSDRSGRAPEALARWQGMKDKRRAGRMQARAAHRQELSPHEAPHALYFLRPVATSLLMVAIVLAGLVGFRFLPLSALPQVDYPTIQVQTLYPGASPEVMSHTVTAPLERQFGQMSGLERMSSTSAAGVSIVTLQFALGQTLDVAEQEVQAAINAGGSLLPADLPAPPRVRQGQPGRRARAHAFDHLRHAAAHRGAEPRQHPARAEDQPGHRAWGWCRSAAGSARGAHPGQHAGAGRQRHRARHAAHAPSRPPTPTAPRAASTAPSAPTPSTRTTSCSRVDDYKNLIVTYKNGAPIRMVDVAQVVNSAENNQLSAWAGNKADGTNKLSPAIITERAAPARRQRDRHRRCHQEAVARAADRLARRAEDRGARAIARPASARRSSTSRWNWCWPWCWWCW